MEKIKKLLPLDIQLFAENPDNPNPANDDNPNPSGPTKEEYELLASELQKMKKAFDTKSSELAESNKKLKAKLSEEEKNEAERLERQAQLEEHEKAITLRLEAQEKKIKEYEISASFSNEGFSKEQIEELSKVIIDGDHSKITETFKKVISETVSKKVQELEQKYIEQIDGKSGKKVPNNENKSYGAELLDQYGSKKGEFRKPGQKGI